LALAKCSAGLFGNSFALVADGLESLTDVFSGLVVYFGLKIAVKAADTNGELPWISHHSGGFNA
jgi:divalent metal cation (Fe/Co/Zn/Cd) transporter